MKRLGRNGDAKEILDHPWFKSIDREKLLKKELQAPYIPVLKDQDDISHFDEKFSQLEVVESVVSPNKR